jgi:hypothetical protein
VLHIDVYAWIQQAPEAQEVNLLLAAGPWAGKRAKEAAAAGLLFACKFGSMLASFSCAGCCNGVLQGQQLPRPKHETFVYLYIYIS